MDSHLFAECCHLLGKVQSRLRPAAGRSRVGASRGSQCRAFPTHPASVSASARSARGAPHAGFHPSKHCRYHLPRADPLALASRCGSRAESTARNWLRSLAKMSMPPGSMERRASSPASTCSDARRFVPASVSTSEPFGKSNAARLCRPASLAAGGRQCRRPAIMRWSTSQRSPSSPMAMRLPIRRRSRTVRPSAEAKGGCAVRSREMPATRTPPAAGRRCAARGR